MLLPERFLDWAYFDRVRFVKKLFEKGPSRGLFIEPGLSFRHTPVFCTACIDQKGQITVNGKVVGAGFILKKPFLEKALEKLRIHVKSFSLISNREYIDNGGKLLLELLYLEDRDEAYRQVDFSKLSTLEIAAGLPGVAGHTWRNLQRYTGEACFTYYVPPTLSYEVRGDIEVYDKGPCHEFVNLVHDCIHRIRPVKTNKPSIILNVKEVYDNSASPKGFGRRML